MKLPAWLRDVVLRGVKTFIQGFTAVLVLNGTGVMNVGTLKAAGAGGLAALLSFVQNLLSGAPAPTVKVAPITDAAAFIQNVKDTMEPLPAEPKPPAAP